MANPKVVVISLSDDEPEVQALVARWRAEGINVSRMFVKGAKKTFIEPADPANAEIKRRLDEILDNVRTR
jgi:hypothetical protein